MINTGTRHNGFPSETRKCGENSVPGEGGGERQGLPRPVLPRASFLWITEKVAAARGLARFMGRRCLPITGWFALLGVLWEQQYQAGR